MESVKMYKADEQEFLNPGTTASGLASAAQLMDVTPSAIMSIGVSASATPLIVIKGVTDMPMRSSLTREPYLSAEDDPILADLWNNPDDAIYDNV